MKRIAMIFTVLMAVAVVRAGTGPATADYVPKDVVWTSPSRNSSESMPCGGHDIGMNVWVEQHVAEGQRANLGHVAEGQPSACSDLLFYVQQSGWFDENNTLLKAGRWRLHLDGAPFDQGNFEQRLCLDEGCVYIKGGGVEVRLWVDVEEPVVFAAIISQHSRQAVLSYESWRFRDRPVTKAECQQCSYKWLVPKDCVTFADSIEVMSNYKAGQKQASLRFWHQNRKETVFDFTVGREHLDAIKDSLYNPIGGLLMQGVMYAPGFHFTGTSSGSYAGTDYQSWNYSTNNLRTSCIMIDLRYLNHQRYEETVVDGCGTVAPYAFRTLKASDSRKRSARWWHQYWQRSWIVSDTPNDSLQAMLRNYELMRYMLGCNARGQWPTKFNGGLFTFDPLYVEQQPTADNLQSSTFNLQYPTPDYRKWGGGTMTAQNQRLVYWPLLKSGDHDVLRPQIDTYLRMLPNAVARTRYYWGHGGASFTEQIENFGLPNPAEYGKHKEGDDFGVERNAWLEYEWDTALEFAMMESLTPNPSPKERGVSLTPNPSPKERGVYSLANEILRFFDEHYQWQAKKLGSKALDENGKLIIYPGSGCETYKMAYNPSSTIAALRAVCNTVESSELSDDSSELTKVKSLNPKLSTLIPDLPLRVIDGDTCIAPAVAWARVQNVETPQLYPVFPWRIYGVGRPGLDIARNTYWKDPHAVAMRSTKGWKQDNIWAACLGLTDEARRLNLEKLSDGPYRFTAFWDPGFDWAPDHNRGGAGMIGLQEMLLQETPEGAPILFPAWPREWDCHFRLHTLGGQTVEGSIQNGVTRLFTEPYVPAGRRCR